jgi:4-diphosphocytidyl-2-C-methyl-D-erythritol kinase
MTRRPRRVVVEARAKLNLGLAVGPKRADGYHEIATFFQSVSLADTLIATRERREFTLRIRHEDAALRGGGGPRSLGAGRGNLVIAAARALARRFGLPGGARFELRKRIPVRAGLGGGSADAAAALVALRALYGLKRPRAEWMSLAGDIGSDVPFALAGGTAFGRGRGDRLSQVVLERPFRALIAVPRWRVSTAGAFRRLDRDKYGLTGWDTKLRFAQSIGRLSFRRANRLGNTFETVLGNRRAAFESLCARLRSAGLEQPRLSGSGSAVFGVIGPRASSRRIIGSFEGTEALYVVRATRSGVRIAAQS